MPTLTLTKNYLDGTLLLADDFDVFLDELESLLNTTKLSGSNIQDVGITASDKFLGNSTSTAKLQANSITTVKLTDETVVAANFNDLAVTTAKINDSAVTTAKINDSAVTTGKLNTSAVTSAKLSAVTAPSISNIADTSETNGSGITTYYAIVSANSEKVLGSSIVTSTGRPIWITVNRKLGVASSPGTFTDVAVGATVTALYSPGASNIQMQNATSFSTQAQLACRLTLYRNATAIYSTLLTKYSYNAANQDKSFEQSAEMEFVDSPAAGSYTYTFGIEAVSGTDTQVSIYDYQLCAMEL